MVRKGNASSGRKQRTACKQILQRQIIVVFHPPGAIARRLTGTENRRDVTAAFKEENSRAGRKLLPTIGNVLPPFRHGDPFVVPRPRKKCLMRGVKPQTWKTKVESLIATRLAI